MSGNAIGFVIWGVRREFSNCLMAAEPNHPVLQEIEDLRLRSICINVKKHFFQIRNIRGYRMVSCINPDFYGEGNRKAYMVVTLYTSNDKIFLPSVIGLLDKLMDFIKSREDGSVSNELPFTLKMFQEQLGNPLVTSPAPYESGNSSIKKGIVIHRFSQLSDAEELLGKPASVGYETAYLTAEPNAELDKLVRTVEVPPTPDPGGGGEPDSPPPSFPKRWILLVAIAMTVVAAGSFFWFGGSIPGGIEEKAPDPRGGKVGTVVVKREPKLRDAEILGDADKEVVFNYMENLMNPDSLKVEFFLKWPADIKRLNEGETESAIGNTKDRDSTIGKFVQERDGTLKFVQWKYSTGVYRKLQLGVTYQGKTDTIWSNISIQLNPLKKEPVQDEGGGNKTKETCTYNFFCQEVGYFETSKNQERRELAKENLTKNIKGGVSTQNLTKYKKLCNCP